MSTRERLNLTGKGQMLLYVLQQTGRLAWWAAAAYIIFTASRWAFESRLHSITNYGSVIHEFDPYFNFRATQYVC